MSSSALTLRILGGLDVGPVDAFEYYAGEERSVSIQIISDDTDSKYALPSAITNLTVTFPSSPNDLAITDTDFVVVNDSDRSIIDVELTEDDTTDMISGWIKVEWDDDGSHRVAYADSIQSKLTTADA